MTKILYLVTFLDAVGMSLTLPLINPNVISLGGSLFLVGVLQSLTAGAQFISSPVIGGWSDTRGRKRLLLITLCFVFISNALSAYSSLLIFFIARIIYGVAHQTDPLIKALVADNLPEDQQSKIFNNLMVATISAFLAGPILGGLLYQYFKEVFSYISIILCTLDIITISVTYMNVEESLKKPEKKEEHGVLADLGKVFTNIKNIELNKYGDLLAVKFLTESAFNMGFMNIGVILINKYMFSRTELGLSISYLSLIMIGSALLSSLLIKLYKNDPTGFNRMKHCYIVLIVFFSTLPFTNSVPVYLSVYIPLCIAKSTIDGTWLEVLTARTTENDKGVMLGSANSMLSLAGLICPLINGFTGDFISIDALLYLPSIPGLAGALLVYHLHKNTKQVGKQE